ncbi:MAG: DUF3570 domain-containing protein [Polyangiaceae bacterium]|nr:DUF3570 domain-containing protein [Polyangiaceae bacterium]
MRLQVIGAFAAMMLWTAPAVAEGRGATWVSFFSSSDHLTVISPQASARVPLRDWLTMDASYEADVITAASVDLVTAASPRGYQEERHGFSAGATFRPAAATVVAAQYTPSFEPDYVSHGVALSAEREWWDRRLTTQVGYRFSADRIGRRGDAQDTWQKLNSHSLTVGLGWVFSRRMVGDVVYELQFHDGFQSSPYRYVPIYHPGSNYAIGGVPESVPTERTRHAIAAGLRRAFGSHWFGSARLRLYADTWGIASFTNEFEVQRSLFGSRILLGLRGRIYGQSSATFHAYRYELRDDALPKFRDADKMLSSGFSFLGGPRIDASFGRIGPISDLRATCMFEFYAQRFFNFAPLSERYATIVSFGVAAEFDP